MFTLLFKVKFPVTRKLKMKQILTRLFYFVTVVDIILTFAVIDNVLITE